MFSSKKFGDLPPKEFKEALSKDDKAVIIDCRTLPEIKQAALDYDLHIDLMSPKFFDEVEKLDRNKSYYIYCRTGSRSSQMCNYMSSKGFENLTNLRGGIVAWAQVIQMA